MRNWKNILSSRQSTRENFERVAGLAAEFVSGYRAAEGSYAFTDRE